MQRDRQSDKELDRYGDIDSSVNKYTNRQKVRTHTHTWIRHAARPTHTYKHRDGQIQMGKQTDYMSRGGIGSSVS